MQQVSYRVARVGQSIEDQPWVSVDAARSKLVTLGLVEDHDFALRRIGGGAGMGVGKDYGVEVLALNLKALECVRAVDIRVRYQSATRDTYERVMPLLPREGVPGSIVARSAAGYPTEPPPERVRAVQRLAGVLACWWCIRAARSGGGR